MARVYVGNVPYRSIEDDVRAIFEQAGCSVSEVVIPKLQDGRSKGFAFVEVDNLEKALTVDGTELDGRPLRVSEARPMQPRDDRGGAERRPAPSPAREETVVMDDDTSDEEESDEDDEEDDDAGEEESEEDDDDSDDDEEDK